MATYLRKDLKLKEQIKRLAMTPAMCIRRFPFPTPQREFKPSSMQQHFLGATEITVYSLHHSYLNWPPGAVQKHQLRFICVSISFIRSASTNFSLHNGRWCLLFEWLDWWTDYHSPFFKEKLKKSLENVFLNIYSITNIVSLRKCNSLGQLASFGWPRHHCLWESRRNQFALPHFLNHVFIVTSS